MDEAEVTELRASITRLTKDLKEASTTLSDREARFLVDGYYMIQEQRIRAAAQVRALSGDAEPHALLIWLQAQSDILENQIKYALNKYSLSHPVGEWLQSLVGIGPVMAAGFPAHIDIKEAPTVGHIWGYAGLDPTKKWEKGKKRPWNSSLKVLCWKAGQSFMKNANRDGCIYGQIYHERKEFEMNNNILGKLAGQAADALAKKNYDKSTDAYKAYIRGMLPPAHIDARARRYAVKLFLAHLHEVMYWHEYKKAPPYPYPMAHMGHAHQVPVPNFTPPQP